MSQNAVTIQHRLDVRDALCPLPLLKLKMCLKSMQPGEVVELLAQDATSATDVPAFCKIAGHELVTSGLRHNVYFFVVQKAD